MKSIFVLFQIGLMLSNPAWAGDTCSAIFSDAQPLKAGSVFVAGFPEQVAQLEKSVGTSDLGVPRGELFDALKVDPRFSWIAADLLGEQVTFAMNRTEARRLGILQNGFLNQYQSHTSGGELDVVLRAKVEAELSGVEPGAFAAITAENRPKYGYLAPKLGSSLARNRAAQGYGEDIYLFKKDRLKSRTTWTSGDSLDSYNYYTNTGPQNPQGNPMPKLSHFLPWAAKDLLLARLQKDDFDPDELALQKMGYSQVQIADGRLANSGNLPVLPDTFEEYVEIQNYVELQFWGPLNLDDVEVFIFTKSPPSGQFLQELVKRKIQIFQHSKAGDAPWVHGPA